MELRSKLSKYLRIQKGQNIALKKLGVETINDLLFHFPVRYGDESEFNQIELVEPDKTVVIFGKIKSLRLGKTFRTKIAKADAVIEDESGSIKATWFNQPYIARMYKED